MLEKLNCADSERSLLGSILNDYKVFGRIGFLKPEHFYNTLNRIIFKSMQDLISKGENPDILSVSQDLRENKKLTSSKTDYLVSLTEDSFTSANIKQNEDRIIEFWRRRQLYKQLTKSISELHQTSSNEITKGILSKLQSIETNETRGFNHVDQYVKDFLVTLKEVHESKKPQGISTGLYEYDRLTGGLKPGDLTIIASRPSHGKTSLALKMIQNISSREIPVGLVSLEMSGEQNIGRLAFALSKVNSDVLNTGEIGDSEYSNLIQATERIRGYSLFIDEDTSGSAISVISKASLLKQTHKIKLIVVDYLQLMEGEKAETRNLEIGKISRSLKQFAIREKIPVLVLCQLSRQAEGKMPNLSDLRDSGELEQNADIVTFIYRPELTDKRDLPNVALLKVAKNRNGAVGEFRLTFLKEFALFENYRRAWDE